MKDRRSGWGRTLAGMFVILFAVCIVLSCCGVNIGTSGYQGTPYQG